MEVKLKTIGSTGYVPLTITQEMDEDGNVIPGYVTLSFYDREEYDISIEDLHTAMKVFKQIQKIKQ